MGVLKKVIGSENLRQKMLIPKKGHEKNLEEIIDQLVDFKNPCIWGSYSLFTVF